jgi:hypothetical protein
METIYWQKKKEMKKKSKKETEQIFDILFFNSFFAFQYLKKKP